MTLRIEHEVVTIESFSATKPDEKWHYVDKVGHEHRFVNGELPSLIVVNEEPYWCAQCRDEHVDSYYACKACKEVIAPHFVADPGPHYLPGLTRYYLDDKPITEAEAKAWMSRG